MLTGLPLLTAAEHCFATTWDRCQAEPTDDGGSQQVRVPCTDPPAGVGWVLVAFTTGAEPEESLGCCFLLILC